MSYQRGKRLVEMSLAKGSEESSNISSADCHHAFEHGLSHQNDNNIGSDPQTSTSTGGDTVSPRVQQFPFTTFDSSSDSGEDHPLITSRRSHQRSQIEYICPDPQPTITTGDFSSDDSVQDPPYAPDNMDIGGSSSSEEISQEQQVVSPKKSSRALKAERKMKRNTGQSYKTSKGKEIRKRAMKPLDKCRMNCKERFPFHVREKVFTEYWNLGAHSRRSAYMASLIEIEDKACTRKRTDDVEKEKFSFKTYRYSLINNGKREPVCRGCLLKIIDESDNFIKTVALKKITTIAGTEPEVMRGKNTVPKNKISDESREEIRNHILSIPSYESHYTRKDTSKRYLPSHLTIQALYNEFVASKPTGAKVPSIKIYTQEFKKLKLSFKNPRSDTCFTCDKFKMQIKLSSDQTSKQELIKQHTDHVTLGDQAYSEKRVDTDLSKAENGVQTYTFDLQQCLPTPSLNTSVVFYKRQLWTFNLTIHDNKSGKAVCYVWYETIAARGANQIASCLYKHMMNFVPAGTKHIIFYSDTCGGQNRNSHVTAMFTWVLQKIDVETIDHKFMIPGHSRIEVDTDHGIIEKKKKKSNIDIYHPHDWIQLIKSSSKKFTVVEMKNSDFLDFSSLLNGPLVLRKQDTEKKSFNWLEKRWLRYEKDFGMILYKNTLDRDGQFSSFNLKRRAAAVPETIPVISMQPLPISKEKKEDLISLFSLIPDIFHNFYSSLPTSDDVRNILPDVVQSDDGSD